MNGRPQSLLAQIARRILDLALESEHGIEVRIEAVGDIPSPTLRAKQILYRFKKERESWNALRVFQSPHDEDCLWVTKQPLANVEDFEMETEDA